jgi:LuxR family maltose regulon positive regulatory protein
VRITRLEGTVGFDDMEPQPGGHIIPYSENAHFRRRNGYTSVTTRCPARTVSRHNLMTADPAKKRSTPYLAKTKVTPPLASPFEIPRQQILDHLSAAGSGRVILVHGPAGFGKTTLMRQLLSTYEDAGIATAWLTLDEGDNDVSRFLSAFAAAVARMSSPSQPMEPQPGRNAELARWILDRLGSLEAPLALFFDDFEVLRNPVVISLIARGIESVPANGHIVIGSRTLPDVGLARLRARGALTEIDAARLRFSEAEAGDFMIHRRGVSLNPIQVAHLYRSTEGWVTALWLASLALEKRDDKDKFIASFSGSNAAVAAYLAEDVLSALPEPLSTFMLKCSVLDELDETLCQAVSGREDSLDILHQLERHHLFLVALDDQHDVYRFHGLFRGFLLNQLQRKFGAEVANLHRAASKAYVEADRPIPAIRHAIKSQDAAAALTLLQAHIDELLGQGRLRLIADWLGQLPKSMMADHPQLTMIQAWCLTFTRGPAEAFALISDLDNNQLPPEPAAHLLALRPMLLAMMDRIDEAHALGTEALKQIPEAQTFARAMLYQALTQTSIILGLHDDARRYVDEARKGQRDTTGTFGLVLAESAEALLDLMGGRLKQATARMKLATSLTGHEGARERNGNALAAIQLAEALYENDDCDEAKRLLEVNAPLVEDLGLADALICAHVILARIVDDSGERDRALQLLSELETKGHRRNIPRVIASARLERARLNLAYGDSGGCVEQLTMAERAFPWDETASRWYVANDTLTPVICRLRWMNRSGQAAKAIPLIREALADAEQMQRGRRALKLRILLAEALHADGQHKIALRTLARALGSARSEGFVRIFLEEGAPIQALLRELNQDASEHSMDGGAIEPGSINRWLQAAPTTSVANAPTASMPDPLTPKELQVLALLAQGLSNTAMADRLFVSESTVRTHLRSINLKLHAGNRTQAIAIARQMGLIQQ